MTSEVLRHALGHCYGSAEFAGNLKEGEFKNHINQTPRKYVGGLRGGDSIPKSSVSADIQIYKKALA